MIADFWLGVLSLIAAGLAVSAAQDIYQRHRERKAWWRSEFVQPTRRRRRWE